MYPDLNWGWPVALYLYLAGTGAGALTVSASMLLRGGDPAGGRHFEIARDGAFLAPVTISLGTALLVLELGSFEAGLWFRWLKLFLVFHYTSPMSVGSWLLTITICLSAVYAYTFIPAAPGLSEQARQRLRWMLAWVAVPCGIGTAVYTGVLLGAMPSRPLWNSPILALLFLVSALSTGVAAILALRAVFGHAHRAKAKTQAMNHSGYILAASDMMIIGFELVIVFLFIMYAHLTVGDVRDAVAVILGGGRLMPMFWLGFVAIGLIAPALLELRYVTPTLIHQRDYAVPRPVEFAAATMVLIGGLVLRYVVVVAGQLTGPAGLHFHFQ